MLSSLIHTLTTIIAPPVCAHCKIFLPERHILCQRCQISIRPIVSLDVPITQKHTLKVFALSDYQDPLKSLILAKRFSNITASTQLGKLMADMPVLQHIPIDCFVPIPLHWTRFAKRGFNQAQEIANVLARTTHKPVVNLLTRSKQTTLQLKLSRAERVQNLADAFSIAGGDLTAYHGKHLVLVDDVMTTGTTLQLSARQLLQLKPASLVAVVVCRVV